MIIQKKAYAKINLYLKILNKLPNGYHNIFTVMQKISLCDHIKISIDNNTAQNINITCTDKNIPADKTNTAYKAAELFLAHIVGRDDPGAPRILNNIAINIEITKNIPAQSGLGGGSSNAGSVLLALNEYFNFILPEDVLLGIAAKVGADVPFFVKNINCAICEGIGEIITPEYTDLSKFCCLIIKPVYNISTKKAFEDWDEYYNCSGAHCASVKITQNLLENIHNDFAELIFSQNKNIKEIKDLLINNNAAAANLTGSGSALFGIFDNLNNAEKCRDAVNYRTDIEFCGIFDFLC